jgi:hypothetical protein
MHASLPRELRDMIYEVIVPGNITIFVDDDSHPDNAGWRTAGFFNNKDKHYTWADPFYIDTRLVGYNVAREMVETLYRTINFRIFSDKILQRFLHTDRWARDAVP